MLITIELPHAKPEQFAAEELGGHYYRLGGTDSTRNSQRGANLLRRGSGAVIRTDFGERLEVSHREECNGLCVTLAPWKYRI